VQEPLFGNPPAAFDQFLVHYRYLSGRAAEADEAQFEPEAEGLPECYLGGDLIHVVLMCHMRPPGAKLASKPSKMSIRLRKVRLEVQTVQSRKADVQYKAAWCIGQACLHEFIRRPKGNDFQAYGMEQIAERIALFCIVIDDDYGG
jgi:hypothetical protein